MMNPKKKGIAEVLKIEADFLRKMTKFVRPIIEGYNVLLAIAESDPIMNGKVRARLGKRAKNLEDEMEGMLDKLRPMKELSPKIFGAIIAAAMELKTKAIFVEKACSSGKFKELMGWDTNVDMFESVVKSGNHMMNTIDNAFAQVLPADIKDKMLHTLKKQFTDQWRDKVRETAGKIKSKAA